MPPRKVQDAQNESQKAESPSTSRVGQTNAEPNDVRPPHTGASPRVRPGRTGRYEERGYVVDLQRCMPGMCCPLENIHSMCAHREPEGNCQNRGARPILPTPALPI